jgi:hypothetical protein
VSPDQKVQVGCKILEHLGRMFICKLHVNVGSKLKLITIFHNTESTPLGVQKYSASAVVTTQPSEGICRWLDDRHSSERDMTM